MASEWIDIASENGHTFSGYLSLPPTGTGPGLVLIQEIWGVNEHIRAVADEYAKSGFVVLAPDVFWRLEEKLSLPYNDEGNKKAFECYGKVDLDLAATDMAKAVDKLKSLDQVDGKVGILGYCLGGLLSYRGAAASDVDAAVCFYGGGIAKYLDEAPKVDMPVLFHHGAQDEHIPEEDVNAVKNAFKGHPNATFFDYANAGHGFNCWGRPSMYHRPSALLAQGRTLEFLAKELCDAE